MIRRTGQRVPIISYFLYILHCSRNSYYNCRNSYYNVPRYPGTRCNPKKKISWIYGHSSPKMSPPSSLFTLCVTGDFAAAAELLDRSDDIKEEAEWAGKKSGPGSLRDGAHQVLFG